MVSKVKDLISILMAQRKQREDEKNRHVSEPDQKMTVVLVVECSIRDFVPRGDRHKAVMALEMKLRPKLDYFQKHLAAEGLDASFYVNRRTMHI